MQASLAEKLSLFCDVIRAKDNWVEKILDEDKNLAFKWVTEADLLTGAEDEGSSEHLQVEDAVR